MLELFGWGLGARERIIVNFFSTAEPSIYKGCGASLEKNLTFFSFLFGRMKRKPLYLSQQTTKQKFTTMEFYIYLQNTKTGYKTYSMTTSIECEARNYCEEVEIETKGLLKAYYTTTWEG